MQTKKKILVFSLIAVFLIGCLTGAWAHSLWGKAFDRVGRPAESGGGDTQAAVNDYLERKRSIEELYRRSESRFTEMEGSIGRIESAAVGIRGTADRIGKIAQEMDEILNSGDDY